MAIEVQKLQKSYSISAISKKIPVNKQILHWILVTEHLEVGTVTTRNGVKSLYTDQTVAKLEAYLKAKDPHGCFLTRTGVYGRPKKLQTA
jgi:hypothetical protein